MIFSFVWVFSNVVVALICWHERHGDVLYGMHSPVVAFCLNNEFLLKAITGVALNSFSNVLVQALMSFNLSVF